MRENNFKYHPERGIVSFNADATSLVDIAKVPGAYYSFVNNTWEINVESIPELIRSVPRFAGNPVLDAAVEDALRMAQARANLLTEADIASQSTAQARGLYAHQARCIELAKKFKTYGFFLDPGTGKTRIGLEIAREFRSAGPTLVVCPLSIIEAAWIEDACKFTPDLKVISIWDKNPLTKLVKLSSDADIYVCNYDTVRILEKNNLLSNKKFAVLIIDESSKMKAHNSQITKSLLALGAKIPRRYIMSGTPAPNSPLEYFSQIKLLDENILGGNFYAFRFRYFISVGYQGYMWIPNTNRLPELMNKIASISIRCTKEQCIDLPDQVFEEPRRILLSPEQQKIYDKMFKQCAAEIGDSTVLAANALSKLMKLREITSGFIIDESGTLTWLGDSKLNELGELLEELGDKQVIIWCNFHAEMDRITRKLREDKKTCVELSGRIEQSARNEAINKFKSGKAQYLVAHPACAGHGLTFTNCSYSVYYSLSHSLEQYQQSLSRIHRSGQKNKCTYYFICADKTIDQVIHKALMKKGLISDALLKMIQISEVNAGSMKVQQEAKQLVEQATGLEPEPERNPQLELFGGIHGIKDPEGDTGLSW